MDDVAPSVARRMLSLAMQRKTSPAVAYLCAWTAAEALIRTLASDAGVRPTFALRKNGTLRTHKADGVKLPDVIRPTEDRLLRAAVKRLPPKARRRLIGHPGVLLLAQRVPTLGGRPLVRDSYGQRLTGVLDLALTRDPRYPVWHTIDMEAVAACRGAEGAAHVPVALLRQIVVVLQTIHSNLLLEESDADQELAHQGLPLVQILVEGWLDG